MQDSSWIALEHHVVSGYVRARLRPCRAQLACDEDVPIVVTDGYGRILQATRAACALLGARNEKLVGKRFVHRLASEARGVLGRVLESLRASAGGAEMHATVRSLNGDAFEAELALRCAADDVGSVVVITLGAPRGRA